MFVSRSDWPFTSKANDVYSLWAKTKKREVSAVERMGPEDVLRLAYSYKTQHIFYDFWKTYKASCPHHAHLIKRKGFRGLGSSEEKCLENFFHLSGWRKKWTFRHLPPENYLKHCCRFMRYKYRVLDRLIEAEAERLQCNPFHVLPFTAPEISSPNSPSYFAVLTDDIFFKILDKMEVYDVTICSCVCKDWRLMGLRYLKQIRTLEHSVGTHLTRKREWLDIDGDFDGHRALYDWRLTGLKLTRWTLQMSSSIESLKLTFPIQKRSLILFVNSCPNLKHLLFTVTDEFETPSTKLDLDLKNTRIESLIVLLESRNIQNDVFDGYRAPSTLSVLGITSGNMRYPQMVKTRTQLDYLGQLPNMVACEDVRLSLYLRDTSEINEILNDVECYAADISFLGGIEFKLRYVRLAKQFDWSLQEQKLNSFLGSCPELSVLILEGFSVSDSTVRILGQKCCRLDRAWIEKMDISDSGVTMKTLLEWELAVKQRGFRAKNIHICVEHGGEFEQLVPEFSYVPLRQRVEVPKKFCIWHTELHHLLGIDLPRR